MNRELTIHGEFRAAMSGDRTVKAQCLPFGQIPHTTRLFTDFLSGASSIRQFYPRSPRFTDWFKDEAGKIVYEGERRARVSAVLERQNKAWGASPKTLENIARLRAGACAAVTGQQVGLFGGPLFSILKALTAAKLAEEASNAGVPCVPVFWLATEDHDLAEVNHTFLPGPDATLQKFVAEVESLPDAPVGMVKLGAAITPLVEQAAGLLGESDITALLQQCYCADETLGGAFARLFAGIFADWGVILLDASDPELHAISEPIYRTAAERAAELESALLARGVSLEESAYHQQVKITRNSTLLFALRDGARIPVHRKGEDFVIGEEQIAAPGLMAQIAAAPHHFSANVLLRPVVQDYLLPTLAYTGGPAEVAYFGQAGVIYQALVGRVTPIIPRFSATLIEAKPQSLMERYNLVLTDLFQGADRLREILAGRTLPQDLQMAFEQADQTLQRSLEAVKNALSRLDKTLVDSAIHAGEKIRYQMEQLRARAARAELRQSEVLQRHAQMLSHLLYPEKNLQEREIAGIYFLARHGPQLLHDLYQDLRADCLDHHLILL
jgi:bacillithiol synthase